MELFALVGLDDGQMRRWDNWEISFRSDGVRRFCLRELSPRRNGRIVSVRIEASKPMRAEGAWLESYTPR